MSKLVGVRWGSLSDETKEFLIQNSNIWDDVNDAEFEINEVMTVKEASEQWGLTEGAIRNSIKVKKFIPGLDYRKAGRITLITKGAMTRVYGEPKSE